MPKQKIVADNPESITELEQILEKTYALNDVDKLEDALTHCQQAINLHPKSAEAHNLKGLILDRLGEKQEALAAFQKAVHLDPEFQDAQQNLADVQAEVHDTQTKNLKLNGARHVAKWGAFSFGLALTVNEIISSVFGMVNTTLPVIFQSPFLALTIYSLIFAVFIGAAIAVLGLEAYNEPRRFGILGIISSSIVYFITGTFIHFYSVFSSNLLNPIVFNVRLALMGAIIGVLLGVLSKNKNLMIWLALTGILGWLFYSWRPLTVLLFSYNSKISSVFLGLLNGEAGFNLAMIGTRSLDTAIGGLVIGGLWGWVIGWFEAPRLFEFEE